MSDGVVTAQRTVVAPGYDGMSAFPDQTEPETTGSKWLRIGVTLALVLGPFAGLILAAVLAWGHSLSLVDVSLALFLYVVTGLGITLGFHRGATHGSFRSKRPLMLVLVLAGSMAFQGGLVDWVTTHRKHHAFTDRPGDPHSPYRYGTGWWAQSRGLLDAHMGWFLRHEPIPSAKYAPDLVADTMMRRVGAWFPAMCVASLVIPFLAGWAITASLDGAWTALVWAGLARVAVLQHVTWSVNSLCHMIGDRPYATRKYDRATNLWPLALLSFGESWHNGHHSDPSCARHGRGRFQLDVSASTIRLFEKLGWVSSVHWPKGQPRKSSRDLSPCAGHVDIGQGYLS
jgi:stearoyl-CoA desaturase (delta-9 desaturase)